MSKGRVIVSRASLKNLGRELSGLCDIVKSKDDPDDKNEALEAGIEEILYNIEMIVEGIEYVSDEFQFTAERLREV